MIFAKYCPVKIKCDGKYHGYDNFTLVSGFILYFIVYVTGQNYIQVKIFQLCLPLVDSQFPSSPIPNYLSAIQTFTENNSYSFFWTHLIFNSAGHHELSGSDQISQSYFSVIWLVLSLHAHAAARQSTNSQGFSQVLTLQKMPCSQVLRFSTLFLFRFLLECTCSNTDDMALYSIVLLLQPESHAATVRMCKKWLWRGPWFECK